MIELYFDDHLGLVVDDQGDRFISIAWPHVHGIYQWVQMEGKPFLTYPGQLFTREQVAFILANYEDR